MGGRVVVVESRFDPLQVNVLPLNLSREGGDVGVSAAAVLHLVVNFTLSPW